MDDLGAAASTGYERSDVSPVLVGAAIGGLAVLVAAVALLLVVVFPHALDRVAPPRAEPAAPRLQADERQDFKRLRAVEAAKLSSYGWADDSHSAARIPIEDAMRLTAERGIADWPTGRP